MIIYWNGSAIRKQETFRLIVFSKKVQTYFLVMTPANHDHTRAASLVENHNF